MWNICVIEEWLQSETDGGSSWRKHRQYLRRLTGWKSQFWWTIASTCFYPARLKFDALEYQQTCPRGDYKALISEHATRLWSASARVTRSASLLFDGRSMRSLSGVVYHFCCNGTNIFSAIVLSSFLGVTQIESNERANRKDLWLC